MISSVIDGTERAVSKVVIWLLGTIILSLFLLVGLAFLGYALFLFTLTWFSFVHSALIVGILFILGGYLSAVIVKRCLSEKPNQGVVVANTHQDKKKSMIRDNPAMSLGLSLAAGFAFQSDPRLKKQASKMLVTLAEQYIIDLSEQSRNDTSK